MNISGWGRFPVINANPLYFENLNSLVRNIESARVVIPFGNGRSYGDSALAAKYIPMRARDRILCFDENTGLLSCESGVLLSEIIEAFLPRGWFLKVTPGTKFITIGGAIASDVHGKNHHVEGCFSECVESVSLLLPDGNICTCSKGEELFHATCGGMGLTGVILEARLWLKRVSSQYIEQTTIKTRDLQETFDSFEQYAGMPYSVAWIDCLSKGNDMGRCLMMVGDFLENGSLEYTGKRNFNVPFEFPCFTLNNLSVKAFNHYYYKRAPEGKSTRRIGIDTFFYPLDVIDNWNRIYGRRGFTQYQFILPKESSFDGLKEILHIVAKSGKGSFLAVLKLYGKANDNYLSFPMEGYSLALDFKIETGLFALLSKLDSIVVYYGGRIYLAKDARVSRKTFEAGYPKLDKFMEMREKLGLKEKFNSLQSNRLGL
jgi:FAD/FMN-containing dehydrogenase